MNRRDFIQSTSLFYFQYRAFFLPAITIVVCIILFLFIVIPELRGFFTSQNQLLVNQQQLQVLQENFRQITGFNDQELNNNLQNTTLALPGERNAISILDAISHAASITNVSLRDYNFQPGKLNDPKNTESLPVELSVTGDISNIQKFIHQLELSLPLSVITGVTIQGGTSATLSVGFFAKPFSKASFNETEPLHLLTSEDKSTLDTLSLWQGSTQ